MNDAIGLGIIGFLIICGILGMWELSRPYKVTIEEFERRAKEGPGLLGAGLSGLQKALDPAMEKATIVQADLREGRYDGEQGSGDGPKAGHPADNNEAAGSLRGDGTAS